MLSNPPRLRVVTEIPLLPWSWQSPDSVQTSTRRWILVLPIVVVLSQCLVWTWTCDPLLPEKSGRGPSEKGSPASGREEMPLLPPGMAALPGDLATIL